MSDSNNKTWVDWVQQKPELLTHDADFRARFGLASSQLMDEGTLTLRLSEIGVKWPLPPPEPVPVAAPAPVAPAASIESFIDPSLLSEADKEAGADIQLAAQQKAQAEADAEVALQKEIDEEEAAKADAIKAEAASSKKKK